VAAAINAISGQSGVTATVQATKVAGTTVTTTGAGTAITTGTVFINGVDIGALDATSSVAARGGQMSSAINAKSSQTGVVASFDKTTGAVSLTAADGRNIAVDVVSPATASAAPAVTGLSATATNSATASSITRSSVKLASSSKDGITIAGNSTAGLSAAGLTAGFTQATATAGAGVSTIDLTTSAGSQTALSTLDKAINTITDMRASMGAYQNRLNASIANLEVSSMNLQASRSRILDTDYAKETTNLAKSQIIQQAATAMLAQANQSAQSVLSLLK
jgi:flagellin